MQSMNWRAPVKWGGFGLIAALLTWRIVTVNMGEYFAAEEDGGAIVQALQWDRAQPEALLAAGLRELPRDPAQAEQSLRAAIRENPTEGRSYVALARLFEARGELSRATSAMDTAVSMAPRRTDVRMEAASFWLRRADVARGLQHWSVALSFRSDLREALFPAILRLAEDPRTEPAFAALLQESMNWWPAFFSYAAANAVRTDTVRALFHLQGKGPNTATKQALRSYLHRLQREGAWTEAYFVWLNSLGKEQLGNIGNLYNGGFDEPISNLGFDWLKDEASQVLVETSATYGTTGSRALHVVFRGPRVKYQHLRQHLLLPPGEYHLRGRGRPESLETPRGVQWVVYCLGGAEPLAESERFAGSDQWRHFSTRFSVPGEGCPVQMVRLELSGRVALDYEARGGVWFDDLSVERQRVD